MPNSFYFNGFSKDLKTGTFVFNFRLDRESQSITFQEVLKFPTENIRSDTSPDVIDSILFSLHLILGISYWKFTCPKNIFINENKLTKSGGLFWETVWTKGLGEFFYKNNIDYRKLIKFPVSDKKESHPQKILASKNLLGIGGGKDTVVAAESLRTKNISFDGFIVETQKDYPLNRSLASVFSTNVILVKRLLDPKIFSLNKELGIYNGHVPISAIYAFIGILCGALYGYENIIVSNEKSAEEGNVEYLGQKINHQWSKSFEFEEILNKYLSENISKNIKYFSILRPYTELKILSEFSKMKKYHQTFSSCNRNYVINPKSAEGKWCGRCPKCAFMFIGLSAFLKEGEVLGIFVRNFLDDKDNLNQYKMLLGKIGFKPFECVGTPKETIAAFLLAVKMGNFSNSLTMNYFVKEVLPELKNPELIIDEVFKTDIVSDIPDEFRLLI